MCTGVLEEVVTVTRCSTRHVDHVDVRLDATVGERLEELLHGAKPGWEAAAKLREVRAGCTTEIAASSADGPNERARRIERQCRDVAVVLAPIVVLLKQILLDVRRVEHG